MSQEIFRGIATALITPFNEKGVDYESYGRLIDWQIESGIDAIVACGTSGESPTLSDEEHREVIRFAVERAAGRVPVIAGTGSNCTESAAKRTEYASSVGADAALVVTPYYNKATQEGLVAHFTAIADRSSIPLIVYNVPSRTGCGVAPRTYEKLARHPRIRAIKEANGDISQIVETAALVGDKMDLYSGNDDQIVPILSVGGKGCISVLSNVLPRETVEICRRFFAGDVAGAAALQFQYLELIHALFCEVNPIPVKTALAAMGMCEARMRLPMTPMEEGNRQRLLRAMKEAGVQVCE